MLNPLLKPPVPCPECVCGASLKAAIIGLGQIGYGFKNDPKRTGIWTHAEAYRSVPSTQLVAGVDTNPAVLAQFCDDYEAIGYNDHKVMFKHEKIDIVSICTPIESHYRMVLDAVDAGVKAIFCEKPITSTIRHGIEMVQACEKAHVVLAVNHIRRWDPLYRKAKVLIEQGTIGEIESVVGYYSGDGLENGTHLFDMIRYLAPKASRHLVRRENKYDIMFELSLQGAEGRIVVSDKKLELYKFAASLGYSGYRELVRTVCALPKNKGERFVVAIHDIVSCIPNDTPLCSGQDGVEALRIALEEA